MLRKTKIITVLMSTVILLALATGGLYWYGASRSFTIKKISEVSLTPAQNIKLGQKVTAQVIIKSPWRRRPVSASASAGKGCRMLSEPVITRQSFNLGYTLWKISLPMKPFRTGEIKKGDLRITFSRDKQNENPDENSFMQLTIPAFKVSPLTLDKNSVPTIAGKVDEIQKSAVAKYYWIWIAAVSTVILMIVMLILKRKKKMVSVVITPWERALAKLGGLRHDLADGNVELGICFSRLTDIVRLYLEQRFALKSSKQTTYEFLAEMKQSFGPLEDSQREFLQQFMQAADLVKFAKLPTEAAQLDDAINKAETLIKETRQEEHK